MGTWMGQWSPSRAPNYSSATWRLLLQSRRPPPGVSTAKTSRSACPLWEAENLRPEEKK